MPGSARRTWPRALPTAFFSIHSAHDSPSVPGTPRLPREAIGPVLSIVTASVPVRFLSKPGAGSCSSELPESWPWPWQVRAAGLRVSRPQGPGLLHWQRSWGHDLQGSLSGRAPPSPGTLHLHAGCSKVRLCPCTPLDLVIASSLLPFHLLCPVPTGGPETHSRRDECQSLRRTKEGPLL